MATMAPEYVTITQAAERFEPHDEEKRRKLRFRIQNWVTRNYLSVIEPPEGRYHGRAVRVDVHEVARLIADPPRPGPRKT